MRGVNGRFCEEFTPGYYGLCTLGGMLSAGTTHLLITPLDVLKVNMQVIVCFFLFFPYTLLKSFARLLYCTFFSFFFDSLFGFSQ